MAKFKIPRVRYLSQDYDGDLTWSVDKPKIIVGLCWFSNDYMFGESGKQNPNWRDTLIDLETDDYEFEDGILRRIEKMTLQKIEFEYDIPDGYRFVRFSRPNKDDLYLTSEGKIAKALWYYKEDWIIVEKIPSPPVPSQNTKRHKHADLIHAWADGAEIQYFHKDQLYWANVIGNNPSWFDDTEYRIKPKTKTVRFRNYLDKNEFVCATDRACHTPNFVKWLGDWQEAEVEE